MINDNEFAIFWLKQIKEKYIHGGDEEFDSCRKRAIDIAIKELEKPEERWIPVSERLPEEKDGRVLICMPDTFPYNQNQPFPGCEVSKRVTTGKYSEFSKMWYIGDMCGVGGDDPIAWMPLPEPPKDGDGDG